MSNINTEKMIWAQKVADDLKNSTDKYVVYKTSRPICDIKHMFTTSVELYADNVAFMQKFAKDEPYTSITYREALETVNALVVVEGEATYATFIDHMNALIDRKV